MSEASSLRELHQHNSRLLSPIHKKSPPSRERLYPTWMKISRVLALPLLFVLACSDGGGGTSRNQSASSTRSPACKEMQAAICDRLADQCQLTTRSDCDDVFQSIFCKSDVLANSCASAYKKAPCGETPTACRGVADLAPAIKICNQFVDQVCTKVANCGALTKEDCIKESVDSLNCNQVVGISPTYDTCEEELPKAVCNKDKSIDLPVSCEGIIKKKAQSISELDTSLKWQSVISEVPDGWMEQ